MEVKELLADITDERMEDLLPGYSYLDDKRKHDAKRTVLNHFVYNSEESARGMELMRDMITLTRGNAILDDRSVLDNKDSSLLDVAKAHTSRAGAAISIAGTIFKMRDELFGKKKKS